MAGRCAKHVRYHYRTRRTHWINARHDYNAKAMHLHTTLGGTVRGRFVLLRVHKSIPIEWFKRCGKHTCMVALECAPHFGGIWHGLFNTSITQSIIYVCNIFTTHVSGSMCESVVAIFSMMTKDSSIVGRVSVAIRIVTQTCPNGFIRNVIWSKKQLLAPNFNTVFAHHCRCELFAPTTGN